MNKERICFESTPDIEATIMHLARVRSARKLLETEENTLKAQIKAIAIDVGCDEFLAERDGQMVTIAYLQNTFPRIDNKRLRIEQEEIYNQYLIQPGAEDRYVCITNKALPPETNTKEKGENI